MNWPNPGWAGLQSEHSVVRLSRDSGSELPVQITRLFRFVLYRGPTAEESAAFTTNAAKHGLAIACRVLLNCNEFMFVD